MFNGDISNIDRFEITLNSDTGFFELIPKINSGGNFVYYPEEFPVSYNFLIKVINNNGEEEVLSVDNLQLENIIPFTLDTPNTISTSGGVGDKVFEFNNETNGSSAGTEHNKKGLFYQDANLHENDLLFLT